MVRNRREILQSAAAVATTVLAAPFIRRAEAAEPIKVGSLLDLSGPIGTSGQPMFDAIQLAVAEVNAAGGLLGRPIELINYNTQSTIQLYSQYAQQLALKDRVAVVHGGITSASREAIRPVFDRYRILYFYNVLYEGGVCDRDIFCTGTTPAQTVNKLVPYALKTWGKKVYILAADYNYGQITAKWMTKYTRDGGGTVQAVDFFPLDVTGFTAAATYEGFHLWAEGVKKANSIERMPVIKALETGLSFDGPSGKVTIDHATHHVIRNAYLGKAVDKTWDVIASYPNQPPSDTAAVCNLIKAPNTDKQFVIDVKS
ncbi:MAG TPA: ABC transporter substrate-binding protein [Acetobacteraceae bacterium]|nr:ABC transporter substrate-binding protein [Acetobacteraceae bacterium]